MVIVDGKKVAAQQTQRNCCGTVRQRARQDDMTHKEYLCFHINYACLTQSTESKTGTALPGLLLHEIIKG
ncbi:MAG: hypothetical protein ACLR17_22495 [Enterobacteriaceae bacterium]